MLLKPRLACVLAGLVLVGCASPAVEMTPQQINQLTDQQLCSLHNGYMWETKTELEIGRRNLNCDPDFNTCVSRGMDPQTQKPAITSCMQDLKEKRNLQAEVSRQQSELSYQRQQRDNMISKLNKN